MRTRCVSSSRHPLRRLLRSADANTSPDDLPDDLDTQRTIDVSKRRSRAPALVDPVHEVRGTALAASDLGACAPVEDGRGGGGTAVQSASSSSGIGWNSRAGRMTFLVNSLVCSISRPSCESYLYRTVSAPARSRSSPVPTIRGNSTRGDVRYPDDMPDHDHLVTTDQLNAAVGEVRVEIANLDKQLTGELAGVADRSPRGVHQREHRHRETRRTARPHRNAQPALDARRDRDGVPARCRGPAPPGRLKKPRRCVVGTTNINPMQTTRG